MNLHECQVLVTDYCRAQGWQLDPAEYAACSQLVLHIAQDGAANPHKIIENYYLDHRLVAALQRGESAADGAWETLVQYVAKIVHKQQYSSLAAFAQDHDDLVQTALLEIARGLPSFAYRSRFTTWAAQVVINVIRRNHRDNTTQGRSGAQHSVPLDEAVKDAICLDAQVALNQLKDEIKQRLAAAGDQRLVIVFNAYVLEEQRIVDIAALLNLSPGRVSGLLKTARALLRRDASLREQARAAGIILDAADDPGPDS